MCDYLSLPGILKKEEGQGEEAGMVQIAGLTPGAWGKVLVWEGTIQLRKVSTKQGLEELPAR